jgi:hypothetical protein
MSGDLRRPLQIRRERRRRIRRRVSVAAVVIAVNVVVGAGAAQAAPPSFLATPTFGVPQPGLASSVSAQVTGTEPISLSCQWQQGGTSAVPGTWTDIAGATACSSYIVSSADAGKWYRVQVTATNGEGSSAASSRAARVGGDVAVMCSSWADVWIIRVNGSCGSSSSRRVTNTSAKELWPQLSPDGAKVVYVEAQTSGSCPCSIKVTEVGATGLNTRTLASGLVSASMVIHPSWSPDGQRVAFATWSNSSVRGTLWVVTDTGTGGANLDDIYQAGYYRSSPTSWVYARLGMPVWGSDDRIYFVTGSPYLYLRCTNSPTVDRYFGGPSVSLQAAQDPGTSDPCANQYGYPVAIYTTPV